MCALTAPVRRDAPAKEADRSGRGMPAASAADKVTPVMAAAVARLAAARTATPPSARGAMMRGAGWAGGERACSNPRTLLWGLGRGAGGGGADRETTVFEACLRQAGRTSEGTGRNKNRGPKRGSQICNLDVAKAERGKGCGAQGGSQVRNVGAAGPGDFWVSGGCVVWCEPHCVTSPFCIPIPLPSRPTLLLTSR